jgi:hypothetical protein
MRDFELENLSLLSWARNEELVESLNFHIEF